MLRDLVPFIKDSADRFRITFRALSDKEEGCLRAPFGKAVQQRIGILTGTVIKCQRYQFATLGPFRRNR